MDAEKMSNEELADALSSDMKEKRIPIYGTRTVDHIETAISRLRTSMSWLPMTPDAVFEDGGWYLIALRDFPTDYIAARKLGQRFHCGTLQFEKQDFTHYARITEPNK